MNLQKHHINLVKYEKRYHSRGGGGASKVAKRAAVSADGDAAATGSHEVAEAGVSPRKKARMAVAAKEVKEKAVVTKEKAEAVVAKDKFFSAKNKAEAPLATTEKCVLCDSAFPLPKLFGHVTSRHHVAADRYERVKLALAACDRGELIK